MGNTLWSCTVVWRWPGAPHATHVPHAPHAPHVPHATHAPFAPFAHKPLTNGQSAQQPHKLSHLLNLKLPFSFTGTFIRPGDKLISFITFLTGLISHSYPAAAAPTSASLSETVSRHPEKAPGSRQNICVALVFELSNMTAIGN